MRQNMVAAALVWAVAPAQVMAQASDRAQPFDISAQDLATALRLFAVASGREVIASTAAVRGKRSGAVKGVLSSEQAIGLLLAGTSLRFETVDGAFVIRPTITADDSASGVTGGADIVVTGTRIRGAAPVGTSVITLDRSDIERSGYSTTQALVQSIPQNFGGGPNEANVGFTNRGNASANIAYGSSANLRGLGTSSTLVLINGSRPALGGIFGAFADLSLIPSSAVERIELLPDGASALYGSDAVAGVVNVILRNRFEGAETLLRYGSADGDFDEVQAGQIVGKEWRTGHLTIAYEFQRRGRLAADDRAFATEDLRPFGGSDYRRSFSNPGTIIAADGREFGIPRGQNGVGLAPGQLSAGPNLADSRAGTDLLPRQVSHSVFAAFTKQLDDRLSLTAELLFAERRFSIRYLPDNFGNVTVPQTNPFYVDPIGTGEPVTVNYDFRRDLGPEILHGRVRAITASLGLERRIGPWLATLRTSYGVQTEFSRYDNLPNYFRLGEALADPDPATAFNLFGDGSFTNLATINRVRGSYQAQGQFRVWSTTARADGPVFALPAGDAKLAIGLEYRTEKNMFAALDDEFTPEPVPLPTPGLPATRRVAAAYAELLLPLFGETATAPGLRRLDLSVAARIEDYRDLGTTTNPRVGVTWEPFTGLRLRGTYGTSFRAPGFQEIRRGPGTSAVFAQPLPDPLAAGGMTNALVRVGNSPDIGPEKARTWTAGFELRPDIAPRLHVQATYFDVRYRDRIAMIAADYFNFLANRDVYSAVIDEAPSAAAIQALYAEPGFNNPFGIAPADIKVIIDARTQNLSLVRQNGVDFAADYTGGLLGGEARLGLAGSYLFRIRQKLTPEAPSIDVLDRVGSPVSLRLRGEAGFSRGGIELSSFVNYVGGYTNQTVTPAQKVASWTTVDLQLAYRFPETSRALAGSRIALSISKLLDRAPPFVENFTGLSASGFDPEKASPIGRMISLQLVKRW